MVFILYISVITFLFFINRKKFGKYINFPNLFNLIFLIVILFSRLGLFNFNSASDKICYYMLISIISFNIFSFIFTSIRIKDEKNIKFDVNKKIFIFLSVTIFAIMLPTTIKSFSLILNGGLFAIRSEALSSDGLYSTKMKIIFLFILSPLNKAIYMYSLLQYFKTKKININIILSLLNCIQITCIFGGRSTIFDIFLISVVSIIIEYGTNILNIMKKNKKMIIIFLALISIIIFITSKRSLAGNKGFLFNLYSYYIGSIHLMDVHLENPNISLLNNDNLLYGRAMFSPIEDMIKIVVQTLGIDYSWTTGIEKVNEIVQNYYYVSYYTKMNNNVTFLYVCLRDFGIFGLVLGPLYISIWYSIIYKLYKKSNKIKYKVMYIYILSLMPYFIFEFTLNRLQNIMVFVFISLLYKFAYKRRKIDG